MPSTSRLGSAAGVETAWADDDGIGIDEGAQDLWQWPGAEVEG